MRKNSILTSGGNKECRKSQAQCPRLRLGHQFTCDFEHSLFPWLVIYYYATREFEVKNLCALKTRGRSEARTRVILCAQVLYIKFPCYLQNFSSRVSVNAILKNLPRAYNCVKRPRRDKNI